MCSVHSVWFGLFLQFTATTAAAAAAAAAAATGRAQ